MNYIRRVAATITGGHKDRAQRTKTTSKYSREGSYFLQLSQQPGRGMSNEGVVVALAVRKPKVSSKDAINFFMMLFFPFFVVAPINDAYIADCTGEGEGICVSA